MDTFSCPGHFQQVDGNEFFRGRIAAGLDTVALVELSNSSFDFRDRGESLNIPATFIRLVGAHDVLWSEQGQP
jgi:hypothetical protein